MALRLRLPTHWSEWVACAGMALFTLAMCRYCLWCIDQIIADGGGSFWVGVVRDFRAMTGWW